MLGTDLACETWHSLAATHARSIIILEMWWSVSSVGNLQNAYTDLSVCYDKGCPDSCPILPGLHIAQVKQLQHIPQVPTFAYVHLTTRSKIVVGLYALAVFTAAPILVLNLALITVLPFLNCVLNNHITFPAEL